MLIITLFLRLYVYNNSVSQVICFSGYMLFPRLYVRVDILLTGVCSIIFILATVLSVLCFTISVYTFDVFKLVLVQIE